MGNEKINKGFKITKQHLQGAIAMLLIVAIVLSAIILTSGLNLLGTMFSQDESLQEQTLAVTPSTIEAQADYEGETFILTGFPENEAKKITPEHIFLGGYLANKTVSKIEINEDESITVTVENSNSDESDELNDEFVSNFRNTNTEALIEVSPEVFKDKNYFYQARIEVIYPEFDDDLQFIDYNPAKKISENITFVLKNDSFRRKLTAKDVTITGGIDNAKISKIVQNGNTVSFALSGTLDDSLTDVLLTFSDDAFEKELEIAHTIQKGRVPSVEQSSPIYIMNVDTQELEVFVNNDTWSENFNLSMLKFEGVVNNVKITGYEIVDDKTLKFTVQGKPSGNILFSGRPSESSGAILFDAGAFESGRIGLTADIEVTRPEISFKNVMVGGKKDPEIPFMMNVSYDEAPDIKFELGGVLAGMTGEISEWMTSGGYLKIKGTPNSGTATVKISGLFDISDEFIITDVPTPVEVDITTSNETGLVPVSLSALQKSVNPTGLPKVTESLELTPTVGFFSMTAKELFGKLLKAAIIGVVKEAGSTSMREIFKFFGIGGLDLEDIMTKLNEITNDIDKMEQNMMREFNKQAYNERVVSMGFERSEMDTYMRDIKRVWALNENTEKEKDDKNSEMKRLFDLDLVKTYKMVANLDFILSNLDPYVDSVSIPNVSDIYADFTDMKDLKPGAKKTLKSDDTLTSSYLKMLRTETPFKHNVGMLMDAYHQQWEAELARYAFIITEIYQYNAQLYPAQTKWLNPDTGKTENIASYEVALIEALYRIQRTLDNIKEFTPDEYDAACKEVTMQKKINLQPQERRSDKTFNIKKPILKDQVHVILNKNGTKFFFGATSKDFPLVENDGNKLGHHFLLPYAIDSKKYLPEIIKKHQMDFLEGTNSVFGVYGNGLTFNQFMSNYLHGVPLRSDDEKNTEMFKWWNPKYFYMTVYATGGFVPMQSAYMFENKKTYEPKLMYSISFAKEYKDDTVAWICVDDGKVFK